MSQAAAHMHDHSHDHDHDHHHHHDHDEKHLHSEERQVDLQILAALFGGMMLIAATVAWGVFETNEQRDVLAFIACLLLGTPIVYNAVTGLLGIHHHHHGHDHAHDHGEEDDGALAHAHMDELVALAVVAAVAYGDYLEAGAIAFFMLIGSFIEHRTAAGARATIESLIRITPTRAHRITDSGEEEVDAAQLKPGDRVRVRPGDNIPGDGIIRTGQSTIDQANITGESLPVEKAVDDEVFSGTINETGVLEIEITRAGSDSTLGKVKELILQASQTKPAVVRLLDRYAGYYTPTVLMITAIVWFFTHDIELCISLLLIGCPCALLISAPTAMVAALSSAARVGVLVKNVVDLETASRVTAIVLDKTGTLTVGKLNVTRMQPAEGVDGVDLLLSCATAEQHSNHPTARAVMQVAQKAKLNLPETESFEEVAGRGVRAGLNGSSIMVGRETWIREQGIDLSGLDLTGSEAMSLLFVARDGKAIGWLGLEDRPKMGAEQAMTDVEQLGIKRRAMITGDREGPAMKVASQMHLSDVKAEALPGDKLDLVKQLRAQGHVVAVVGDGVNDGPALAAGNVSIAMGAAGSDVAIHQASIALMNDRLDRIPFLIQLSRRTVNVIRQNLIGVALYIVLMVALLALGYITPMTAAIAHALSSIVVVFNSARLVREGEHLDEHIMVKPEDDAEKKRKVEPTRVKPQTQTA